MLVRHFLSGDDDLYQQMILPIDQEASGRDEAYKLAYAEKINMLTIEFSQHFLTPTQQIDWEKLVAYTSKRP
jgi:site-specific DNA-methyltransferase (cytosine-N4-specific)